MPFRKHIVMEGLKMQEKNKNAPISIFISSTYKDLAAYRNEVETRLVSMEQSIKGMEYFGASSETPLTVCKQKIGECKLMILLIGVSYGSIEPVSGKSYTEYEYDFATELGIPTLCYIADTSSSNLEIPFDAIDTKNKDLLDSFKEKVRAAHLVSEFTTIEDIGLRILHDVPAELEKLSVIKKPQTIASMKSDVNEDMLREGANEFEKFWLRPQRLAGKLVPLRMRLNKKLNGWKVKDELIRALGLTVGDSISTEVSVQLASGIIDDKGDTDLFADGDAADWLIDQIQDAGTVEGCIVDCYVRFVYSRAPVGGVNGRQVNTANLVLVEGIRSVGVDNDYAFTSKASDQDQAKNLMQFLKSLQ